MIDSRLGSLTYIACFFLVLVCESTPCAALSLQNDSPLFSRRDLLWKVPVGGTLAYGYGKLAASVFSFQGIRYPAEHERRVESTIYASLLAAATAAAAEEQISSNIERPFRVLEIGVGTDCRLMRRGLYDSAIHDVTAGGRPALEWTGLDIQVPTNRKVLRDLEEKRKSFARHENNVDLRFHTVEGSITAATDMSQFDDGFFDSIICCMTLCSVDDPVFAVQEMKRMLRPNGGTLGYVEHVAVDDDQHPFLEWQQQLLDPLQQKVADNCHLHRYTEQTIDTVFASTARKLQHERFYVDNMWPVSCQCCGVVQLV
jgi:SAM-dependent methyltransferase